MTELVTDVPITDAVGALEPSQAQPVDDVSNAVTQIKEQRDTALKGSLNQALTIDPDKAASNQALSDKTGIPVDVVNRNEEAIQQRARANDIRSLVSTSPVLEQQLFNPQFAALAHDDVENLNTFERTLRTYLGASAKSGFEQLLGVTSKLLDVSLRKQFGIGFTISEEQAADKMKDMSQLERQAYEDPRLMFSRFAQEMQRASTETMKNINPAAQIEYGDLRYATLDPNKAAYLSPIKVVGDAIQSLPTSLALGLSVYFTKGVAARTEAAALASGMSPTLAREAAIHAGAETMARLGAATEGAAGYGQQYMQTRQQADEVTNEQLAQSPKFQQLIAAGYSPEAARLRLSGMAAEASGAAGGVVDAITNYFGGRFLGTILTEGGRVAARTAKGFATEALTEAIQSGGEQLSQNLAVKGLLNPNQEMFDQVMENIAQGFVVGGVTGGAFGAVAGAKHQQEVATHDAAVITKLSEIAEQSELRARSPETFAQFVNAAAAQGQVDAVWIDAKGFAQSMAKAGMDQAQLAQKMPETSAALPDALTTNGKVRIPTGEFMATFPGTGVEKELIPQLSTTPEGPTVTEAHDASFVAEAQKQVEAVLSKQEFTGAIKESMGNVERELLGQLTTANRFTKDVNGAYAKLMASFYTVMGQRVGLTPEQMYVKYPLNIKAENVASPNTLTQEKTSNPVGWWEGPGGTTDVEETNYVPTLRERVEGFADDRRWHANPNYKPEVFKSNRPEKTAEGVPAVFKSNRLNQAAVDQTQTPEFKKWFGDSKVVDADGKPLVVYHGTDAVFDEFKKTPSFSAGVGRRRGGFYFHPEERWAGQYGKNIMPVYLKAERPFDYANKQHLAIATKALAEGKKVASWMVGELENGDWEMLERPEVQKAIRAAGFDSYYANDFPGKAIAVYSPEQIKSAIGNRGAFDPNDPNILHQSAPPVRSSAFKKWFKKSKVVDANGKPLVVYHGTTGDFTQFDKARANTESDLGGGFYFTNTLRDVNANYAGEGPDLTSKIERRAEQIVQEKDLDMNDTTMADARRVAKEQLGVESQGAVLPVYLSIQNPAQLGGEKETFLTYDSNYDEKTDEYGEPTGTLVDFLDALQQVSYNYYNNEKVHEAIASVQERFMDDGGGKASEILDILREEEGILYLTDEKGDLVSHEAVREALERAGFDGVIDHTVNEKFGYKRQYGKGMEGVHEETVHYIAFHPEQIKSVNNRGTYSTTDPNILNQSSVPPSLWYYSALQAQVEALKVETAPAAEWKKIIEGLSQKGVKKAEVEASGILDWLYTLAETGQAPAAESSNFTAGGKIFETYGAANEYANDIARTTGVIVSVEPVGAQQFQPEKPKAISRDEILAYLHTDGETEVRTTILGEPMQDGDVIESEDDFSEDDVETRAKELWYNQLEDEAQSSARGSAYVRISEPKLVVPTYEVVKLPADMIREGQHWGIKELSWDIPTDKKDRPNDLDELKEMYPDGPRKKWASHALGVETLEFSSSDHAQSWALANIKDAYDGAPYWTATDYDGNEIGQYDSFDDANQEVEKEKENRYQQEVQSYIENASFSDDSEYWMGLARRQLENEGGTQTRGPNNTLATVHPNAYQTKGGKDYREMVLWVPGIESFDTSDTTHFGHIGEGKGVVWVRYKTHQGADGKPVLFVDEIQSKRAQQGREEGFSDEPQKVFVIVDKVDGRSIAEYVDREEAVRAMGRMSPVMREMRDIVERTEPRRLADRGVPTAPFVKDTQAWVALAMKRIIRYAVDHNIDRVAWTVGQQQIGFYTHALQENIRELTWKKTDKGIEIDAVGRSDSRVLNRTFSDKELRVAAGGDITDQIVNSPETEGRISGENLRFNAVWPAQFYGNEQGQAPLTQREIDDLKKAGKQIPDSKPSMVTAVANKILAQMGGGKVETIPVQIEPTGQRIGVGAFEREKFVSANQQPGFTITPAMKEAVLGKGFPLFQGGDKNRGGISFGEGIGQSPATIMLLQNADLSTFLHESGHFYLEVMNHMASQENAPPELKRDMASLLNWFGVKDMATWSTMTLDEKRPYHEQFARGFEAYLFDGTTPSPEMKGIFARFRAWMLNVYRQLSALNVQLTDEVRGVLDRMLATNSEIIAAENQRGYSPLFDDAAKMGVSQDEWKGYQDLGTSATQDAVDTLQTRSLRDMKWLSNARNAEIKKLQASAARVRKGVRAEVAAEVNAQPIYQAMRWLKTGETVGPEGEAVKAEAGFKLNTAALASMYPATGLGNPDLKKLGVGKYGMTSPEGLDPNLVAEMFGFSSGDELVRKLVDVEPARSVIEGMTDQRMLERYGDLTSQQAIATAADKAIHNELRAKVLATELAALTKATGSKKLLTTAARDFAQKMIARKKLRDIRPAQYEAAEARAAKAAQKAFTADKIVEAATEKRNELVNNYAAKAAHTALDEINSSIAYLRKVADSKTIDPAYREQITAMLERFDLRQTTLKEAKRKASLLDWMESQKDQGFEPVIDPEIANEAMRMPYQEMTMEQFRGLTDSVRNIEHLGRLKHKLLKLADQREFTATVDAAVAEINANAKQTLPQRLEHNTWSARMRDGVTEFFAMHRKFASLWREMDGFKDNGKLWQLFVRPMNQSGDTETTMREQATIEMQRIFKPLFDKGHLKEKTFIPAINASLSREGRLMVALNTGNDGNLQRLMDGDHWTKKQVDAIVDTLSKTEMDFVQATWDLIGAYKKQIGDLQKRLTGMEPEWVEPRQVVTQHGVYAGGYLPAKYDTTRSTRALADEAAAGIMDQWRGVRGVAKTRDSFTKERASKVVNRPLRKDFGVVTQHITEVIHRLSWQEYLTDANRLLRSRGIDTAIRDHYGPETLDALRHTLEDVATGELPAQNAFERSINYIRQGATIAGLGWRLTTALLQPIGLTQSMVRIGPKYVARGLAEFLGDSTRMENSAKRIYEKSEFMRLRAKTMQREINEIRNQVEGKNTALVSSYFYLITKMQLVADIPTWLGQYHKAIEGGADELNARAQADQAVIDAQGSGQIKDLSAIQRGGPMLKLFTNFYSFFNTTYNLTAEAYGRTNFKNPLSIGRLMVDVLLLYSVPAALGTLMKAALHSGDDTPDWEEKLARQLIADQMTYWLGTMVGLREISGAAQTALGLTGDYQGPASVRLFASIAELGKQINQGEVDEALLKAADNVGGVLFHYPAGQINATVDGLVTMGQGKTDNPGALIVGSNRK